jgi:hypothetical protein
MKKVTIYGERCSGTNYLEELLLSNFDIEIVWNFGWKHFFGFNNLNNSDDFLFIGIIRNLEDWINSLYRDKHHLPLELTQNINTFLNNTFYSLNPDKSEIMQDRNIETNNRYKNIFELRYVKNKFLIETMPKLVKNYCLITYDELCDDFVGTINKLKNSGMSIKENIDFPLNIKYYKKEYKIPFIKKNNNKISKKDIIENINFISNKKLIEYEKLLFPKFTVEL